MKSTNESRQGSVDLLQSLKLDTDPASEARDAASRRFLEAEIFHGLQVQHPSFDSVLICHFNASDFSTVVERCLQRSIQIIGVEVFTAGGELLEVNVPEDGTSRWCLDLLDKYCDRAKLSFCATYFMPDSLL